MSLESFKNRIKPLGVLYVDIYPYRLDSTGNPEFLALKRNNTVELASTWQAISGKIREDETIRAAMWRQCEEKLGLTPKRLFKIDFVNVFYDDYYDTVMHVPTSAAELSDSQTTPTLSDLHTEFQWVKSSAVQSIFIWPNQIKALEMIANMIEQKQISTFHLLKNPKES